MTLVSVIIPCYNYGHFLPETLNSISRQTLQDWECLIVDDGSTDNTAEVVAEYTQNDSRFCYIYQENAGPSVARNNGIRQSKGEFIQLLDSDDLIQSSKLEFQVTLLQQKSEVDIIYGDIRFFFDGNSQELFLSFIGDKKSLYPMPRITQHDTYSSFEKIYAHPLHPSALLIRKKFLTKHQLFFEEAYRTSSVEDWHFFIAMAMLGGVFFYKDQANTYGLVRSHDQSTSSDKNCLKQGKLAKHREFMLELLSKNLAEKRWLRQVDKKIISKIFATRVFKEFSEGSLKTGTYFLYLSLKFTNHQGYFIKNALYYLKRRIIKGKIKF